MSEKKVPPVNYPQVPSAPMEFSNYGFPGNRGPPPSYEESQKNIYPQHPPPAYPQGSQFGGYPSAPSYAPGPSAGGAPYMPYYNQAQGFPVNNAHMHNFQQTTQQRQFGVVYSNMQPQNSGQPSVEFDSGARFKGKGAGSISVPPPPPGYLPTPAQLAAMQGQPVMLKKKKNSFF